MAASCEEMFTCRSLLYVRLDGIGDGVLALQTLEYLPAIFPNASFTIVCDTASYDLYASAPNVTEIIAFNKRSLFDEEYLREAVARVQACNADVVFNGTLSPTPTACILMLQTGAPIVSVQVDAVNLIKEDMAFFNDKITTLIPPKDDMEMDIDLNERIVRELGVRDAVLKPKIWLTKEDNAAASQLWERCGLSPDKTVVFFAAGGVAHKTYFRYGEALGKFFAQEGYCVAAIGGPGDFEDNEKSLADFRASGVPVYNFCSAGSLRRDAAFIRDCRLALGADTAMAHIACAFDVPLVVLVPGANFGRFIPYNTTTTAVYLPLECAGCSWRCRYTAAHCIAGISPATVLQAVEYTLGQERGLERKTLFMQRPTAWKPQKGEPSWRSPAEFIAAYETEKQGGLKVVLGT
ncbi:MAG: hypothetical protein DELT_01472 [Desulfovibrio sp.]